MLTAKEWARAAGAADKPWLILGKGPTFAKFASADTSRYGLLALNHTVREGPCDAVLMMDFDVFDQCADAIAANARHVLMPWWPHVEFRPGGRNLQQMTSDDPRLQKLEREARLVVFNAQTARDLEPFPGEPVTPIKFFSAEAALNLLAAGGAREIRTLGVDGGGAYAGSFADLRELTLLANGQTGFDRQFAKFSETLRRHRDLIFGPLHIQTPVRVFVGSDATQLLGARVLEYSIRRYASMSVRFEVIDNAGLPIPKDPQRRARTGFSFCRFKIPALCSHRGRAIYMDADMQVFTDIRDLWTRPFGDAWLLYSEASGAQGRVPQYSVMLMDCERLGWDAAALVKELDAGTYDYNQLMSEFAMMSADRKQPRLEFEWNSLEHYEAGRTKLIHYTDMPSQPWVSNRNKNAEIWYAELRKAIADGFVTLDEIDAEIDRGHISPLLPEWAGLPPHPRGRQLFEAWTPPYSRLTAQLADAKA